MDEVHRLGKAALITKGGIDMDDRHTQNGMGYALRDKNDIISLEGKRKVVEGL